MGRTFKERIFAVLEEDYPEFLDKLLDNPPEKTVNVLFSALLSRKEKVRWHSIIGFGKVVKVLACKNLEKARVVMRRLMWMLNDESGGIGWGAPESMAEIMVNNRKIADEYHKVFLSYLLENEEGKDNFLEFLPLRRGGFWGLARLCNTYYDMFSEIGFRLSSLIKIEEDPFIKIFLYLALNGLGKKGDLPDFLGLNRSVTIFWNYRFITVDDKTIGALL